MVDQMETSEPLCELMRIYKHVIDNVNHKMLESNLDFHVWIFTWLEFLRDFIMQPPWSDYGKFSGVRKIVYMKKGQCDRKLWPFVVLKVLTKLYQLAITQSIYRYNLYLHSSAVHTMPRSRLSHSRGNVRGLKNPPPSKVSLIFYRPGPSLRTNPMV